MRKTAFLLALIMVFTMTMSVAGADDNVRTSGLFTYSIKGNGTAVITRFHWAQNGSEDIFVPSMIDGYTVTGIGDEAFRDTCYDGKSVKLENIHAVAVTLPDTITTIGRFAFRGSRISTVNIPKSVKTIGEGCFAECHQLSGFRVAPGHDTFAEIDGGLYHKGNKELIGFSYALGAVKIPKGIVKIGNYSLYGIGKLE